MDRSSIATSSGASFHKTELVTATEERIRAKLFGAESHVEVFIAYWGDTPAGYVLFYKTFSTFVASTGCYVEDLFVFPEFRNRGVGTALIRRVIDHGQQAGYHKVEWYVNNRNRAAIKFYEKLGATKLDYKSIYYVEV